MLAICEGGIDAPHLILNDVTGVPAIERRLTERLLATYSLAERTSFASPRRPEREQSPVSTTVWQLPCMSQELD